MFTSHSSILIKIPTCTLIRACTLIRETRVSPKNGNCHIDKTLRVQFGFEAILQGALLREIGLHFFGNTTFCLLFGGGWNWKESTENFTIHCFNMEAIKRYHDVRTSIRHVCRYFSKFLKYMPRWANPRNSIILHFCAIKLDLRSKLSNSNICRKSLKAQNGRKFLSELYFVDAKFKICFLKIPGLGVKGCVILWFVRFEEPFM